MVAPIEGTEKKKLEAIFNDSWDFIASILSQEQASRRV
jgi:hypothetical protein